LQGADDGVDSFGDRRKLALDSDGNLAIFSVHEPDDLGRGHAVEIFGSGIAMFGATAVLGRTLSRVYWHRWNYIARQNAEPSCQTACREIDARTLLVQGQQSEVSESRMGGMGYARLRVITFA
jgi:hypothetical protein